MMQNQNIQPWPWGQGPSPAFANSQPILPTSFPPPASVDQNSLLPNYQQIYGPSTGQPPPDYGQWTAAQLQQWQQWQQWQEKYQQWQAQYGKKYAESLAALGQNPPLLIPSLPPVVGLPKPIEPVSGGISVSNPPLPVNTQPVPPPPPDEEKPPLPYSTDGANSSKSGGCPVTQDNPEELSEAEKTFDIQFKQWEGQFNEWKKQNQDHPDKVQYKEYEKKWETWREQLLQRREQMRKKRLNKSNEQINDEKVDCSKLKPVTATAVTKPESNYNYKTRPSIGSSLLPVPVPESGPLSQSTLSSDCSKLDIKVGALFEKTQEISSGTFSAGNSSVHQNTAAEPVYPVNNSGGGYGTSKVDASRSSGPFSNAQNFGRNRNQGYDINMDKNSGNQGPYNRFGTSFEGNSKFGDPSSLKYRNSSNSFDEGYGQRPRPYGSDNGNFGHSQRFPVDNFRSENFNHMRLKEQSVRERENRYHAFAPQERSNVFNLGGGGGNNEASNFQDDCPSDGKNLRSSSFKKVPSLFDITVEKPPNLIGANSERKPKIWDHSESDRHCGEAFDRKQEDREQPSKTDKPWMNANSRVRNSPSPWLQPWEIEKLSSQKAHEPRPWDRVPRQGADVPWLRDIPKKQEIDKAELSGYVGNILAKLGNFNVMTCNAAGTVGSSENASQQPSGEGRHVPRNDHGTTSSGWNKEDEQNVPKNNLPPSRFGENNFRNQREEAINENFVLSGARDADHRVGYCRDRLFENDSTFPPKNFDHLDESRKDADERNRFDVDERIHSSRNDRVPMRKEDVDDRTLFGRDEKKHFPKPDFGEDPRNFGNDKFLGREERGFGRGFGRYNARGNGNERNGRPNIEKEGRFFDRPRPGGPFEKFSGDSERNPEPVWNPQVFDYSQGRPHKLTDPDEGFKISTIVDYSHGEKKQTFDYCHGEVTKEGLETRSSKYGWPGSEVPNVIDYGHGADMGPFSKDCRRDRSSREGDKDIDDRLKPGFRADSPARRRSRSPRGSQRSHSRSPHARFKRESNSPSFRGIHKSRDALSKPLFRRDRNGSEDKLISGEGDLSRTSYDVTTILVEDLICLPGRESRPNKLVFIMRGIPGSGKTYVTKLIKDKEVELGGEPPRILSLDDYFMTEVEKEVTDKETGRKIKTKAMEYEYEAAMEPHYKGSLLKAFKKTVSDGFFGFIIVDSVNEKTKDYEEMWSFAKQKGFQVYIAEMDNDVTVCKARNIHKRTEKEISDLAKVWEETPSHFLRLDVRSLLQSDAITEVEMEVVSDTELDKALGKGDSGEGEKKEPSEEENGENDANKKDEEEEDEPSVSAFVKSRWDQFENSEQNLDRLDGLKRRREGFHATMEEYLQLPEDIDSQVNDSTPGKKRVRWADLEERRQQEKMRAIGFVVGQTDWNRMTDPTFGENALTRTKYI